MVIENGVIRFISEARKEAYKKHHMETQSRLDEKPSLVLSDSSSIR